MVPNTHQWKTWKTPVVSGMPLPRSNFFTTVSGKWIHKCPWRFISHKSSFLIKTVQIMMDVECIKTWYKLLFHSKNRTRSYRMFFCIQLGSWNISTSISCWFGTFRLPWNCMMCLWKTSSDMTQKNCLLFLNHLTLDSRLQKNNHKSQKNSNGLTGSEIGDHV